MTHITHMSPRPAVHVSTAVSFFCKITRRFLQASERTALLQVGGRAKASSGRKPLDKDN